MPARIQQIKTVAVYSDADAGAQFVKMVRMARRILPFHPIPSPFPPHTTTTDQPTHATQADEAHWIGPPPTTESYLVKERILAAAKRSGAQGLHPGYGFLSENPEFAQMCQDAGVVFIGAWVCLVSGGEGRWLNGVIVCGWVYD